MNFAFPKYDRPAENREINRGFLGVWRVITFLLVFLGFLALAFTGEIEPLVMVAFVATWGITILIPHPMAWLHPWAGKIVVLAVLLGIGYIGLQIRFESLLYLLMFLGLYKCVNLREPSDHLHAILMAFFMILATSIITNSISFLVFMLTFIVLATLDMICLTLAREAARSRERGSDQLAQNPLQRLGGSYIFARLLFTCTFNAVPILLLAFGLFFILPHYHKNAFSNPMARPSSGEDALSGYSDEFSLDNINRLALDNTRVMNVRPSWTDPENDGQDFPADMRLRGISLEYYDEDNWKTQWESRSMTGQFRTQRAVNLPAQSLSMAPEIELVINQDFSLVHRMFGASIPHRFEIPPQLSSNTIEFIQQSQAVEMGINNSRNRQNMWAQYQSFSDLADEATPLLTMLAGRLESLESRPGSAAAPPDSPLANVGPNFQQVKSALAVNRGIKPDPRLVMNESLRRVYTQLPDTELTGRIRRIAERQTRSRNAAGMAVDFNNWFEREFEYSLSTNAPASMHPIDAFLTRTKSGHCEYFATAMVLMLRSQGVPARVATGFYTQQYDREANEYLVVQSDAHAWAEVFIDGLGWLTLDPTPPDQRGRASLDQYKPPFFKKMSEQARSLWQTYILDYSRNQQTSVHTIFFGITHHLSNLMIPDSFGFSFNIGSRGIPVRIGSTVQFFALAVVLIFTVFFGVIGIRRLSRLRGNRPNLRSPVKFMNQLVSRMQAAGYRRRPSETPIEFLNRVEPEQRQAWELDWLLEVYHRIRFGGDPITPGETRRIHELLRNIR